MRIQSITMMAACVVASGLTLAGCQTNGTGSSSGAGAATTASAAAVNAQSSGTATASAQAAAGSGATGASTGNSESSTCQAADLTIALDGQASTSGSTSQYTQTLGVTNKGSAACTMDGFFGVDLVGAANGQQNYSWPLERSSESYSTVTLKSGESAYFGINYLASAAVDSAPINVTKIELTPPNTTTTVSIPWSVSVVLQDAATHPGTYLSPVVAGK